MAGRSVKSLTLLLALGAAAMVGEGMAASKPEGELTYAMRVTPAPAWFDPGLNTGDITPKMLQYGLHDTLFKPMPEGRMTPGLAESSSESAGTIENYFVSTGTDAYVNHPPLDEFFRKQDIESDPEKREAVLREIQRIAHERVGFVPLYA